MNYDGCGLA